MQNLQAEIEEDFIHQHSDDAYVEDDLLPDLVLDTTRNESSSSLEMTNDGSNSSSVIDLLISLTHGRRSISAEGIFIEN